MKEHLSLACALPADADAALLVGRVHVEGAGAMLVRITPETVHDISALAATCSELLEIPDLARTLRSHAGPRIGATADLLANTAHDARDPRQPWFLAPCDLQAWWCGRAARRPGRKPGPTPWSPSSEKTSAPSGPARPKPRS
jgi:fumarylacetoacetate (FAA) hydrolase family protein